MTLFITEQETEKLLSIKEAIPVIEEMFQIAGHRQTENPSRFRMPFEKGVLQFRAAALHPKHVMGFKLSTHFGPKQRHMWNFLYNTESGELLAIIQSYAISILRTSAASAVAAKYLTRPDASVIGMYGAGRQSAAHLEALCAVRPIKTVHVYSRNVEKREAYCRKMSERLGIDVIAAKTPQEVPRQADILLTITNSDTPVLCGAWISRPMLVIGVGANQWYRREIDQEVIAKAALIVVDEIENAKIEAGDLLWAVAHGLLRWEQVEELGDIVSKRIAVPDLSSGVILYESQGVATEDVAIAAKAYELARVHGVGTEMSL